MRVAWAALVVLVLLAPFGRVGITATPLDADVVTAPRSPGAVTCARPGPAPQPIDGDAWHGLAALAVVVPRFLMIPPPPAARIAAVRAPWLASVEASAEAQPRAPPA
jgi:hypothetical protein